MKYWKSSPIILVKPVEMRFGYAKFFSRSHHAVIRVYDEPGDVIETHEHKGEFKES